MKTVRRMPTVRASGCVIAAWLLAASTMAPAAILHVDDDAPLLFPQGGDGSSWPAAFRFLQDALDAAKLPGANITEIRIAQRTYKPDQGSSQTPGDVFASFHLVNGVIH